MPGIAIQRNAKAMEVPERPLAPVIRMRVRQEDGVDLAPRGSCRHEPSGKQARPQTRVKQETEPINPEQTGIPAAAAGQNGEG